jgi:hypothetical protein
VGFIGKRTGVTVAAKRVRNYYDATTTPRDFVLYARWGKPSHCFPGHEERILAHIERVAAHGKPGNMIPLERFSRRHGDRIRQLLDEADMYAADMAKARDAQETIDRDPIDLTENMGEAWGEE